MKEVENMREKMRHRRAPRGTTLQIGVLGEIKWKGGNFERNEKF